MGRRLPSAGELLIIRPAGKRVSRLVAPTEFTPSFPESLPGSPGIPKQDPIVMWSDGMQLLLRFRLKIPNKSHFLRFKEPK